MSAGNCVDIWLGDSWVVGSELYDLVSNPKALPRSRYPYYNPEVNYRDYPLLSYPHIVSTKRKNLYYNLGKASSGIDFSVISLLKFIKSYYYQPYLNSYTVFMSLTCQSRYTIDRYDGTFGHMNNEYERHGTDTGIQRSVMALNQVYLLSKHCGFTLYVIPIFEEYIEYPVERHSYNIVPEKDVWLTKTPLVTSLFGLESFSKIFREFTEEDRYIYPCKSHPNIEGHKVIADYILSLLEKRS